MNPHKLQTKSRWHQWFAWHPISVDGRFVFFKKVERRADCYFTVHGQRKLLRWQYRLIDEGVNTFHIPTPPLFPLTQDELDTLIEYLGEYPDGGASICLTDDIDGKRIANTHLGEKITRALQTKLDYCLTIDTWRIYNAYEYSPQIVRLAWVQKLIAQGVTA